MVFLTREKPSAPPGDPGAFGGVFQHRSQPIGPQPRHLRPGPRPLVQQDREAHLVRPSPVPPQPLPAGSAPPAGAPGSSPASHPLPGSLALLVPPQLQPGEEGSPPRGHPDQPPARGGDGGSRRQRPVTACVSWDRCFFSFF